MSERLGEKSVRNARVQRRYDELLAKGKHGHYETMFCVVREECRKAQAAAYADAASVALALDSNRGNEKLIARALKDRAAEVEPRP